VERQRSKLANLEQQVQNCRITAPTNGVVIYHSTMQASRRRWGGEPLQAGSTVVERQELIQIPIEGGMIVELSVPESSLTKLKLDQPAKVKVEAIPGVDYTGRLSKIGLLPDGRNAWLNPDLQLYNCEIELDNFDNLRSGMNCETDMQIEHHEQAISVPIQCVIRVGTESVVYVAAGGKATKRPVKTGLDNSRMVHILDGLTAGEKVLMNPPLEAGAVVEAERPQDAMKEPTPEAAPMQGAGAEATEPAANADQRKSRPAEGNGKSGRNRPNGAASGSPPS
jgi:HlyD family secretion protein